MSQGLSPLPLSVIMPTIAAVRFLNASIASVQAQGLDDSTLIAAVDRTSDESLSILHRFAESVSWIRLVTTGGSLGMGHARSCATRADLLKTYTAACLTVTIDRKPPGPWRMQPMRLRQDFLFLFGRLTRTPKVLGLPVVFRVYSQHGKSLSSTKGKADAGAWIMHSRARGLTLFATLWCFGLNGMRGILRRKEPRPAQALGGLYSAILPT